MPEPLDYLDATALALLGASPDSPLGRRLGEATEPHEEWSWCVAKARELAPEILRDLDA